ncbi:hypothetical protein LSH36_751g00016 [Paralvinella palmiformis]|uniref:Protein kinase domain-containing protein n=1 Tax=Paralvinella palmiformis TaxID=53620 RepID=A0AAD9MT52_9ANNE|nr:hypothetical protein LSH36_751g00016 [Paralvinella palmiformis]
MENRPISGSDNYIWFLEESLGHGSMGHVYVGRHRHSGDKYAVKVFNKELKMMQKDYVKIELDILKHIPAHKNIVKILGVEVQAENGEFQSITGTEEYLHPDMHRDLFISKISGGQYNSHVDLWSFGVTVYQCASGQFPFIPRQGVKSDKQTMQMLTRHKEPGVISQIEMPDGHTLPSQKLPDQCYLTR